MLKRIGVFTLAPKDTWSKQKDSQTKSGER